VALQVSRTSQLNAVKAARLFKRQQNRLGPGYFWIRQAQPCAKLRAPPRHFRVVKGVLGRPVLSWFRSDQKRGTSCRCFRKAFAEVLKRVERVGRPSARVIVESGDETSVRKLLKIQTESLTHSRIGRTVDDRAAAGLGPVDAERIDGLIGKRRYQNEVIMLREIVEGLVNSRSIRCGCDCDTDDGHRELVAFMGHMIAAAPIESAHGEHRGNGGAMRSALMLPRCTGTQEKPTSKFIQDNAPSDV
jgi:hypothetical protein